MCYQMEDITPTITARLSKTEKDAVVFQLWQGKNCFPNFSAHMQPHYPFFSFPFLCPFIKLVCTAFQPTMCAPLQGNMCGFPVLIFVEINEDQVILPLTGFFVHVFPLRPPHPTTLNMNNVSFFFPGIILIDFHSKWKKIIFQAFIANVLTTMKHELQR